MSVQPYSPINVKHAEVQRARVLSFLSEFERSRLDHPATALLPDGEDYLAMEHLEQGVRMTFESTALAGKLLMRANVDKRTWERILEHLLLTDEQLEHLVTSRGAAGHSAEAHV
jgi:hypothetical protein